MNNLGALEPESQPHPPPHIEVPIFKSGCDALDETRLDAELNAEIEKGSEPENATLKAMERKQ